MAAHKVAIFVAFFPQLWMARALLLRTCGRSSALSEGVKNESYAIQAKGAAGFYTD